MLPPLPVSRLNRGADLAVSEKNEVAYLEGDIAAVGPSPACSGDLELAETGLAPRTGSAGGSAPTTRSLLPLPTTRRTPLVLSIAVTGRAAASLIRRPQP